MVRNLHIRSIFVILAPSFDSMSSVSFGMRFGIPPIFRFPAFPPLCAASFGISMRRRGVNAIQPSVL